MRILHTEASHGWGGQEIRILREAEGMRRRGHEVIFAVHPKARLGDFASKAGFQVVFIPFKMSRFIPCLAALVLLIRKHRIELINTHSSIDAWIGGTAGRLTGRPVVRTRHLSTAIRKGWNSVVLYNWLANGVATTCEEVVSVIRSQAKLPIERCRSIPTGVDPEAVQVDSAKVEEFRRSFGISPEDCVAGTLCVLRSWKGISDLLQAASLLKHDKSIKWLIIGSGPGDSHYRQEADRLGLGDQVIFTGHMDPPYTALGAIDIFLLLSTANEGVSQASLQAAFLEKPLITTPTGGLKEVAIPGKTGMIVSKNSPQEVSQAVAMLAKDSALRSQLGSQAKRLVLKKFLLDETISSMEKFYHEVLAN